MIRLTVIVPVHDVEPFVGECLASVLATASDEIEVIAVDDASTDGSRRILDEVAERDRRLRVVALDRNVGQAEARNVGLATASGEHVWFVDGDDELVPGALDAVLGSLAELADDPVDALLVDYERLHPDGRIRPRWALDPPGSGAPLLSVYPAGDHAALFATSPYLWNKVLRRGFLDDEGLRLTGRWYEDQHLVALVLVLGRRFAVLRTCGYRYRLRDGSATQTSTDRHFESIEQWEAVFERLAGRPELDRHRGNELVARMDDAMFYVLDRTDRLPPGSRARYYGEMARLHRAHRSGRGSRRAGPTHVRLRAALLGLGSYRLHGALEGSRRLRVRARASVGGRSTR